MQNNRLFLGVIAYFLCMSQTCVNASTAKQSVGQTPLKYFIFKEECYDKFIIQDFSDTDCIKFTISKGVGLAIVAGSAILKVPQIVKILSSGSVEGISSFSYYVETVMFMQTAGLAMSQGIPFSVYGESLIIMAQNVLITFMIWSYNRNIGAGEKLSAVLGVGALGYAMFTPGLINQQQWQLISSSNSVLNVMSKMPQIYSNFCNKSTGQMAFATFFLSFAGGCARTATVLFESDDFMFRLQFIVGLFLNFLIICQFALYWNVKNTKTVDSRVDYRSKGKKNKLE